MSFLVKGLRIKIMKCNNFYISYITLKMNFQWSV